MSGPWAAPLHELWNEGVSSIPIDAWSRSSTAPLPSLRSAQSEGWRSDFEWSFASLAATFGFLECTAHSSLDRSDLRRIPLGQFIEELLEGRARTAAIGSVCLRGEAAAVLRQYEGPSNLASLYRCLEQEHALCLRWLIIGPRNSVNRLHADLWNTAAWNVLLAGAKTWLLVSPPWDGPLRKYSLAQRPGEILYVPSGWRHEVLYDEHSIAITENYVDRENAAIVSQELRNSGQTGLAQLTDRLAALDQRAYSTGSS